MSGEETGGAKARRAIDYWLENRHTMASDLYETSGPYPTEAGCALELAAAAACFL